MTGSVTVNRTQDPADSLNPRGSSPHRVHRGDYHSNNSRLSPPDFDEIARLAELSRSIQPGEYIEQRPASPPRSLRRRLSPQAIADLVARYTAGEGVPGLSGEYGISESGLRELLRAEGVVLRGHKITVEDSERAVRLYASGVTIEQVAQQLGYAWGTIRRALLKNGVTLRTGPELEDS